PERSAMGGSRSAFKANVGFAADGDRPARICIYRDPAGMATLDDLAQICAETAIVLRLAIDVTETGSEGEIIFWMQECGGAASWNAVNPFRLASISVAQEAALRAAESSVAAIAIANDGRPAGAGCLREACSARRVIAGFGQAGSAPRLGAIADTLKERCG
ncbi:MAG: type II 3-dehydroquinate dehydratase, partial [Acetobacteraceae bacterium]